MFSKTKMSPSVFPDCTVCSIDPIVLFTPPPNLVRVDDALALEPKLNCLLFELLKLFI